MLEVKHFKQNIQKVTTAWEMESVSDSSYEREQEANDEEEERRQAAFQAATDANNRNNRGMN